MPLKGYNATFEKKKKKNSAQPNKFVIYLKKKRHEMTSKGFF